MGTETLKAYTQYQADKIGQISRLGVYIEKFETGLAENGNTPYKHIRFDNMGVGHDFEVSADSVRTLKYAANNITNYELPQTDMAEGVDYVLPRKEDGK